jgi:alkanesulfonate monooxygenase SsuD/methylene tetrahydromethanopterin reductase-like flavin-dependent oxidoreductase (luciferase family)
MKTGFVIPTFAGTVDVPLARAAAAVRADADAVFAVDHLFPPGRPDRPSLEPFSLLAVVAAAEPRVGVGVLVARAGMRPAGLLAKQASSLHGIAGNGAILGLGMGDALVRAEHESFGLPFPAPAERAALVGSTARAVRALRAGRSWPGDAHVPALPGPLAPPGGPPVWVGGTTDRLVDVAAAAADGWNGWGLDAEAFADRVSRLRRSAAQAGRDPGDVVPTWGGIVLVGRDRAELDALEADRAARGVAWDPWRGTVDDLRRFVTALAAAGAGWFVAMPAGPEDRTELIGRTLRDG